MINVKNITLICSFLTCACLGSSLRRQQRTHRNSIYVQCFRSNGTNVLAVAGDGKMQRIEKLSITIKTLNESLIEILLHDIENVRDIRHIIVQKGATTVPPFAFWSFISLNRVYLPESLRSIGRQAFCNCESLRNILIPPLIKEIPEGTFKNCKNLREITIPKNVIGIGKEAFLLCRSLSKIIITGEWSEIGELAFACCVSLRFIKFHDKYFDDEEYFEKKIQHYRDIEVYIRSMPNKIANNAFFDCPMLLGVEVSEDSNNIFVS